jgi:hypothetical protein
MPLPSSVTSCKFCHVYEGTDFGFPEKTKVACCARCGLVLNRSNYSRAADHPSRSSSARFSPAS